MENADDTFPLLLYPTLGALLLASSHRPTCSTEHWTLLWVVCGDVISSSTGETHSINSAAPDATLANVINNNQLPLSSKLVIYNGGCRDRQPEILIIGDSIIRSVELPGAITYCLPGSKVAYIIELSPVLTDLHPSAHTLIVHVGTNDVMFSHLQSQSRAWAKTVFFLAPFLLFQPSLLLA